MVEHVITQSPLFLCMSVGKTTKPGPSTKGWWQVGKHNDIYS